MRSCLYSAQFLRAYTLRDYFPDLRMLSPTAGRISHVHQCNQTISFKCFQRPSFRSFKLCKVERTHHHNIHLQKKKNEKTLRSVSLTRCFGWLSRMNWHPRIFFNFIIKLNFKIKGLLCYYIFIYSVSGYWVPQIISFFTYTTYHLSKRRLYIFCFEEWVSCNIRMVLSINIVHY